MYQVGIIGCGGISASHYEGFTATGRAKVTWVYDTDATAAAAKAAAWGAHVAPSGRALIAEVDIVVVATPGFARREYVERAAAAGKHLICEKPLALNLEDALALAAAVARAGVKCQVNFQRQYDPAMATVQELVADGTLGPVVNAWVHNYAPASSARWRQIQESGHWRASQALSGGRINEFCSHDVCWLLWVLGAPRAVYGRALRVTEGFGLDDADLALLTCAGGTGLLEVHRHAGVPNELHCGVLGQRGSAVGRGDRVILTLMDQPPRELPARPRRPLDRYAHFLDCIERDQRPLTGLPEALATLRVCLAFNRSAATGQVEPILSSEATS